LDSLTEIPSEMLFASASGLDPHISPQAALLQVDRIAKARGFDLSNRQKLVSLVNLQTENPQFSLFGESRINVLILNIKLNMIN
jgi:potassium-transporting ATPase KdpC subunit